MFLNGWNVNQPAEKVGTCPALDMIGKMKILKCVSRI